MDQRLDCPRRKILSYYIVMRVGNNRRDHQNIGSQRIKHFSLNRKLLGKDHVSRLSINHDFEKK